MNKIQEFINKLKFNKIEYYMLATKCEFDIEYLPEYAKHIQRLTGFTGSNGILIIDVSLKKLYLFTDARYLLQAQCELNKLPNITFEIIKIEQCKPISVSTIIKDSRKIIFDLHSIPVNLIEKFENYESIFCYDSSFPV